MAPILSSFTIFIFVLLISNTSTQESTILSYLIDVEEQQRQDFLELTITTSAFQPSLQQAISQAESKAYKIKGIQEEICTQFTKNKKKCKQSSQIGKVKIQPKYQTNKKKVIFEGIKATYQILIKVDQVQQFGPLVDKIIQHEGFVIDKIEWKPDEDLIKNNFIAQSMDKSQQLCQQLNLNLKRLISVQEVREEPEKPQVKPQPEEGEQEQQQEEQEQQPEQEQNSTVYRITVQCSKKSKKN